MRRGRPILVAGSVLLALGLAGEPAALGVRDCRATRRLVLGSSTLCRRATRSCCTDEGGCRVGAG